MRTTSAVSVLATLALGSVVGAMPAQGALLTPTAATASITGFGNVTNLINNSGLPGNPTLTDEHANGNATNVWSTPQNGADYYAPSTAAPVLTFDLGGTFTLASLHIWQYAFSDDVANDNQARTIGISFGTDGVAGAFTLWGSITMVQDLQPTAVQNFSLGGVSANAMQLTLTDNFFGQGTGIGGDRVGLSEVKLSTVPEPASLALVGVAVFGISLARRARLAA